ncbi:hypothetical protein HanPSC8_Chr02g0082201 [Helianthus annuus]|nr:hypothetical protein HanPSC8_Chr02g0082201 [Helianthus annuus]
MIFRSVFLILRPDLLCWVYISMQCVLFRLDIRKHLRDTSVKNTHIREFAILICKLCACNRNLSFALIQVLC